MSSQLRILVKRLRSEHWEGEEMLQEMYSGYAQNICSFYIGNKQDQIRTAKLGLKKVTRYIRDFDLDSRNTESEFREWLKKKILFAVIGYLRTNLGLLAFMEAESMKLPPLFCNNITEHSNIENEFQHLFALLPSSSKLVLVLTKVYAFTEIDLAQCFEISVKQAKSHQMEMITRINEYILNGASSQSDLIYVPGTFSTS